MREVSGQGTNVALVAVLRSELFGIADTVLYEFRCQGGRFSYNSDLPTGLTSEDAAAFKDAFDRLKTYAQWLRRMPAAAAIERIAADLGLLVRAGLKPHGAEKGGAEWGTVLHTMLEAAMNRPDADLHSLALSALDSEGLSVTLAGNAVDTVKRVTSSRLWQRARKAQRCLTEVPLGTLVAAGEANTELSTVLRGVIDLVFREPSGWVVVDYRTDRVKAGDIPALVNYYRPQIEAYGEVWERVLGETVTERGLFFTQTGDYAAT